MQLRIFTEPQQGATYDDLLAVARATEDLGFDAFFRSDHYLAMGDGDGRPGPTDAWVTLAGLARDTTRVRLGTLVSSATFRQPGPLAVAVAQVDQMSGGRVELGLGTGWFEEEHEAFGIPFPPLGERFDRLEEQLQVLRGLWEAPPPFSFEGKHYRLLDNPVLARPAQHRLPVIVGGGGARRTPRLAATYADEFNMPFASLDDTAAQFARVKNACAATGRELVYSAAQVLCVGRDEAEIARRAAAIGREVDELRQNGLAGTPDEVAEKASRFAAAGASCLYLQVLDLHDLEHLELVASKVAPQLA
ncbi:LLM class F420-dependent oxidoreductase [Angustibacter sp. Root456]|uniref:LLM class F420-dependent oxidoreductase n=1 Tax=Angustibacter sp. Root456 TaxID=1736539 RepID=UPI0007001CE8|nr:LLM class F420-dependent oxidoreductase [Angustibacter sp. Root456]KQX61700.1 LLM class F420-dependent oxidoreductase [Angustibacter sp. Root456]